MDIHKPKPWHGLREFLKEYGIIVLGVLTALALEQGVEWGHWTEKVETAQKSLDHELMIDTGYAQRILALRPCEDRTIAFLEDALTSGRTGRLGRLYALDPQHNPFVPRPWRASAWETVQTGDVATHLGQEKSDDYAIAFRFVSTERELQWKLLDDYSDVMSARHGSETADRSAPLAALERYSQTGMIAVQAARQLLIAAAGLGVHPSSEAVSSAAQDAEACLGHLRTAGGGAALSAGGVPSP